MNTKKLLVTLALVVITVLGAGAVYAQQGTGGGGPGGGGGRGGRQGDGLLRELLTIVADATGLDVQEIATQVRDGATVAEIITASGGDVDAVVAQVVEAITTRVNDAVAAGTITQERADAVLADLEANVISAINGELQLGLGEGRLGGGRMGRALQGTRILVNAAAEATGLDAQEIASQVRDGATLAGILTDNGVEVDAFIELAVAQAEERLTQAVENGRLTQEEADARLTQFREELTTQINEVPIPEAQSA